MCDLNQSMISSMIKLAAAFGFVTRAIAVACWRGVIRGSELIEITRFPNGSLRVVRYHGACGELVIRYSRVGLVRSFSLSRRSTFRPSPPPGEVGSKSTGTTAPATSQRLGAASSSLATSGRSSPSSDADASLSSEYLAALR